MIQSDQGNFLFAILPRSLIIIGAMNNIPSSLPQFAGLMAAVLGLSFLNAGCNSPQVSSSARADASMTTQVGQYSPPPAGLERARLGVPSLEIDRRAGAVEGMNETAADILTGLALNSQRFRVIERTQLNQLIEEQRLEGVVRHDEVTAMGQVRGVDYLMLGKITNFRVMQSSGSGGFGIGQTRLPFGGAIGAFDYSNRSSQIDVEVGVDLRLVNPETGEVKVANFSEYERSDSIRSFGVQILGVSAGSEADLQLSDDDQGRVLRLALDDALRKMLPQIDMVLQERARGDS